MEKVKIFILGIVLYLSRNIFERLYYRWFTENLPDIGGRVREIRILFYKSLSMVCAVIGLTSLFIIFYLEHPITKTIIIRIIVIIIALTATLSRSSWQIQTCSGNTIIERIEKGMYQISQLGSTSVLLILLSM